MGYEIHDVETANTLLVQEVNRMGIFLTEHRHQYIGAGNFFLAYALDMQHGTLNNTLEANGRLRLGLAFTGEGRNIFI